MLISHSDTHKNSNHTKSRIEYDQILQKKFPKSTKNFSRTNEQPFFMSKKKLEYPSNIKQNPDALRKSYKNSKSKKEMFVKNKKSSKTKKSNKSQSKPKYHNNNEYNNFEEIKKNKDSKTTFVGESNNSDSKNNSKVSSRNNSIQKNKDLERKKQFVNISEELEQKQTKFKNLNINTELDERKSDQKNFKNKQNKEFYANGNISFGNSLKNNMVSEDFDTDFNIYSQHNQQKYKKNFNFLNI